MKRGARDSQVVNNFFTFATIIIIAVVISLYTKYVVKEENKTSKLQVEKLECQREIYTFIKVSNQNLLNKSFDAIKKGYYKLDGGIIESLYSPSKISEVFTLKEIDKLYIDSIGINPKKDIKNYINIKYELIEEDKKASSKKEQELKAGSIMSSFQVNSKEIFRVYTDFAFMYKNALKKRIDCSIKVLKNYANARRK